jgi:hypothetical protein
MGRSSLQDVLFLSRCLIKSDLVTYRPSRFPHSHAFSRSPTRYSNGPELAWSYCYSKRTSADGGLMMQELALRASDTRPVWSSADFSTRLLYSSLGNSVASYMRIIPAPFIAQIPAFPPVSLISSRHQN